MAQVRDRKGRYTGNDAWSMVFLALILGSFILILNHFNASRLDEYSQHYCQDVYGLNADCK